MKKCVKLFNGLDIKDFVLYKQGVPEIKVQFGKGPGEFDPKRFFRYFADISGYQYLTGFSEESFKKFVDPENVISQVPRESMKGFEDKALAAVEQFNLQVCTVCRLCEGVNLTHLMTTSPVGDPYTNDIPEGKIEEAMCKGKQSELPII